MNSVNSIKFANYIISKNEDGTGLRFSSTSSGSSSPNSGDDSWSGSTPESESGDVEVIDLDWFQPCSYPHINHSVSNLFLPSNSSYDNKDIGGDNTCILLTGQESGLLCSGFVRSHTPVLFKPQDIATIICKYLFCDSFAVAFRPAWNRKGWQLRHSDHHKTFIFDITKKLESININNSLRMREINNINTSSDNGGDIIAGNDNYESKNHGLLSIIFRKHKCSDRKFRKGGFEISFGLLSIPKKVEFSGNDWKMDKKSNMGCNSDDYDNNNININCGFNKLTRDILSRHKVGTNYWRFSDSMLCFRGKMQDVIGSSHVKHIYPSKHSNSKSNCCKDSDTITVITTGTGNGNDNGNGSNSTSNNNTCDKKEVKRDDIDGDDDKDNNKDNDDSNGTTDDPVEFYKFKIHFRQVKPVRRPAEGRYHLTITRCIHKLNVQENKWFEKYKAASGNMINTTTITYKNKNKETKHDEMVMFDKIDNIETDYIQVCFDTKFQCIYFAKNGNKKQKIGATLTQKVAQKAKKTTRQGIENGNITLDCDTYDHMLFFETSLCLCSGEDNGFHFDFKF